MARIDEQDFSNLEYDMKRERDSNNNSVNKRFFNDRKCKKTGCKCDLCRSHTKSFQKYEKRIEEKKEIKVATQNINNITRL
jgi:hypothetical protein